jgi:5-methylcytosine-specific restriction endonuclease McrA
MAIRHRPQGQCSHCGNVYPETNEFFHEHRRRGRVELRSYCKECFNKQTADYQQQNADAVCAYQRKRLARPHARQLRREALRRFHAKPECRDKDRKRYRKIVATREGREKLRVKVRKRRARVRGAARHHTAEDVRVAMEVQQGRCFYCECDVSTKSTVDHLIPLVRGGSDGPENIVIACPNCNFRKADKTPEEFAAGIKHRRSTWRSALQELHF